MARVRPKDALKVFPGGLTKLYEIIRRIPSSFFDSTRLSRINLESAANPKPAGPRDTPRKPAAR
jgi:hypothetical protein